MRRRENQGQGPDQGHRSAGDIRFLQNQVIPEVISDHIEIV
jgi:hypothetical protein